MASTSGRGREMASSRSALKLIKESYSRLLALGWLEGLKRQMGEDVLDSDHDPKRRDLRSP